MARAAERLNNAIVALDWSTQNAETAELAADWVWWWNTWRHVIPETSAVWLATMRYYWVRYRDAYRNAGSKRPAQTEYQPDNVEPTIPAVVRSQVDRHIEAYADAGRTAIDSASLAARSTFSSVAPWLLAAAGLYWFVRR